MGDVSAAPERAPIPAAGNTVASESMHAGAPVGMETPTYSI